MESESDPINKYKEELEELSSNSLPMINMLTMLSEDYKDSNAPQIVRCIEQRLKSVSPDKKLPLLYLMDSICKNVGQIYIKLFTQNIVSTFCNVFEKVDHKTRLSLYRLRQSWTDIFPVRKLYAIDSRLHNLDPRWYITAPKPTPSHKSTSSGSPSQRWSPYEKVKEIPQKRYSFPMRQNGSHQHWNLSPNSVVKPFIANLSSPLSSFEVNFPYSAKGQVGCQSSVPTTIPAPNILGQTEMINISRMEWSSTFGTTIISMTSPFNEHNLNTNHMMHNIERPFPSAQDRDYRREFDSMMGRANDQLNSGIIYSTNSWNQIIATKRVQNVNNTAPSPSTSNLKVLLSKLIATGKIDNSEHRSTKISNVPPIPITSDSLKLSRPSIVAELYSGKQCTNCSIRFEVNKMGVKSEENRYSKHLDWHFRQNRRDKANSRSASMGRNWYYPLNLWLQFKEITEEDDDMSPLFTHEKQNETQNVSELPLKTVIAERDDTLNVCSVCREKFDQKWSEDEEEWILQNAVKHNDKICHPFCLKDFISQTERLEQ